MFSIQVDELKRFVADHGFRPSPHASDPTERDLGGWLTSVLGRLQKGELTEKQIDTLDVGVPGWVSLPARPPHQSNFARDFEEFRAFYETYDRLPWHLPTPEWESGAGAALVRIRQQHALGSLSDEQLAQMNRVNSNWDKLTPRPDHEGFLEFVDNYCSFVAEHGMHPRRASESEQERSLYIFMDRQRSLSRQNKLNRWRREVLDDVAPTWHINDAQRHQIDMVNKYVQFYDEHSRHPLTREPTAEGRSLGFWLHRLRRLDREGTADQFTIELLSESKPDWRGPTQT